MNQSKTVILMGAGFSTPNMGVWALASGAITSALLRIPEAKIYLLDYNKEPAKFSVKHPRGIATVELINIRISKRLFSENHIIRLIFTALVLRLIRVKAIRGQVIDRTPFLKIIDQAQIIGSIAGGDSFSDIYGLSRLLYVSLPQFLILLLGKPLILLPQTIGPFKGVMAKAIARLIIRRAQKVYSRDVEGLSAARIFLDKDHGKIAFSYDLGFVLEPEIASERIPDWFVAMDRSVPLVGLNVSGLLYMGGYTRTNMFGLKTDYRGLVNRIIKYFAQTHGANIVLIPHVFGGDKDRENDVSACREIYQACDPGLQERLNLVGEGYDHQEIKALIGRCDFFLGSRMHACIAALSQSIPAVGIAYSNKFFGVYRSIGVESCVIDLRAQDDESSLKSVDQIYQRRFELSTHLKAKMQGVRASVSGIFA